MFDKKLGNKRPFFVVDFARQRGPVVFEFSQRRQVQIKSHKQAYETAEEDGEENSYYSFKLFCFRIFSKMPPEGF